MNWDAIGACAEMLAAIGVITSLVYLADQMRQNTVAARRSNARQTTSDNNATLRSIAESGELSAIMIKGFGSLEELNPVERYRFDIALVQWLFNAEQTIADHKEGILPESTLVAYKSAVPTYLNTPGGVTWWGERSVWFSQEFRETIDTLVANLGSEGMASGPKL
jgi:hypothetical protein